MYLVNSYRHKSSDKEEGTEAQQKEKKSKEGEEEEEKKEGMSTDPKDGLKGPAADMFDVSRLHAPSSTYLHCEGLFLLNTVL